MHLFLLLFKVSNSYINKYNKIDRRFQTTYVKEGYNTGISYNKVYLSDF